MPKKILQMILENHDKKSICTNWLKRDETCILADILGRQREEAAELTEEGELRRSRQLHANPHCSISLESLWKNRPVCDTIQAIR